MVVGSRIEGGPQFISTGVRKTIQSIKEIVGNHSDADIYAALKESNMDPNETTQKLLSQDPFHEVKRKRDKKKEVTVYKGSTTVEPRKYPEQVGQGVKFNTYSDSDRNVRKRGYIRNAVPDAGVTREFRAVKDNRNTQTADREMKPPSAPSSTSTNDPPNANVSPNSSSTGTSNNQKPPANRQTCQHVNGPTDSCARQVKETVSTGINRNDTFGERRPFVSNAGKQNDSLNNSVVGVYSSSLDPVHVPSLDSRQAANVGAIKREIGARHHTSEHSSKMTSEQANSFLNTTYPGQEASSKETSRSFTAISKSDQRAQTSVVAESDVPIMPVTKPFLNNNRSHQQVASHQKAPQPNKEWKPKSSQKPSAVGPGVIGTPIKAAPSSVPNFKDLSAEAVQLQDKLSRANIHESQNVIIAAHIRVSETDRCRLTFGSLGTEVNTSHDDSVESIVEPSASVSLSPPESSSEDASVSKQVESFDERVRSSGSISPPSATRESPRQKNLESYPDVGLVRDNTPSYTPSDPQQQQDPSELQSFAAYDSQGGYDVPYFKSAVDEPVRGQVLSIPQEVLVSDAANIIPASTIAMVQQAPVAQMYPAVHVSHYANVLPYRQFLSPMYLPQIAAMPGYSNHPAAYSPLPSNGSSYILMPGPNSPHLTTANGLKYGIQQFKPLPTGNPTGFGNFTSPAGYTINAPGVGSATGLDDTSRLKYKDGNLYVPNPQGETSELWMNPRDMQSGSYYNMGGQTPYMASHTSFNTAPQSSHMQFPGMYHHPQAQPAGLANPHQMGGNVGGAPGPQYQHTQLGHGNWSGNF